ESGRPAPPAQPASDLHDPIARARRRPRQEPGGGSLPFRQRPHHPPRHDDLRQTHRADVFGLAAPPRRSSLERIPANSPHGVLLFSFATLSELLPSHE